MEFIDDLAIVVLFSVFEQVVRSHVQIEAAAEVDKILHPILRKAAGDAIEQIETGSFARVVEPYKPAGNADLIEEVNQVRRYRNWVAHGRRGEQPPIVDPKTAYQRLSRLLIVIGAGGGS
ncbi:MAG TPA: hypothetical protein VKS79_05720 [Gemmataceae bacterium]|nr:hypothetical protein [Gemmataceae bacterium]